MTKIEKAPLLGPLFEIIGLSVCLSRAYVLLIGNTYSVSQKKSPLRFSDIFFPKRMGIFNKFFTPITRSFLH